MKHNLSPSVVAASPFEERVGQWMLYFAEQKLSFDAVRIGESMGRPPLDDVARAADAQFYGGLLNASGYRRQQRTGLAALFNPHTGERSGTLQYPTLDDARAPEEMPADWTVERAEGWGRGVLVRGAERVPVEGEQWTGGGDLPLGGAVHVEWRRSPTGRFNVVARVSRPLPVAAPPSAPHDAPMATQRAAWTTTWRFAGPEPVDDAAFEAAIAATFRAFGIEDEPSVTHHDGSADADLLQAIHAVCVDDDSVTTTLSVQRPMPMKGEFEFTGETLELRWADVEGSAAGLFVLLADVVHRLGGEPEREDEDDCFVSDLESRVRACVLDHLGMSDIEDDEALEKSIVPTVATVTPGTIGPYALTIARDQDGIRLLIRGAGRDVQVAIRGQVLALSDAALEPLYETFRTELAQIVADEQPEARSRIAPDAEPAFGGKTVLHGWRGDARVSSRAVEGGPGAPHGAPESEDVAWDLVRYLPDGTPVARWSNSTVRAVKTIPYGAPSWTWAPSSAADAPARFAALARHLPSAEPERWTLRSWYAAFCERTGMLRDLSLAALYAHLREEGAADVLEEYVVVSARTAASFMAFLLALARSHGHALAAHRTWLCRGAWWDDAEHFAAAIHRTMGLPGTPSSVVPPQPPMDEAVSLEEYLEYANDAAQAAGIDLRAYSVAVVDGDDELVVCLPEQVAEALLRDGLLFLA